MYRVCIALVGSTRARFFTFDRTSDPLGTHEQMTERADLMSPGVDGIREPRAARSDAEFARTALAALRELIDDDAPQRVVMCAGPRMLGRLWASAPGLLPDDVVCDELARDLVTFSPTELRAELMPRGLLLPKSARSSARAV